MTPKDKCDELIDKFSNRYITNVRARFIVAVEHSILAVDEIIDTYSLYTGMYEQDFFDSDLNYFKEVKNQLLKLQNS